MQVFKFFLDRMKDFVELITKFGLWAFKAWFKNFSKIVSWSWDARVPIYVTNSTNSVIRFLKFLWHAACYMQHLRHVACLIWKIKSLSTVGAKFNNFQQMYSIFYLFLIIPSDTFKFIYRYKIRTLGLKVNIVCWWNIR